MRTMRPRGGEQSEGEVQVVVARRVEVHVHPIRRGIAQGSTEVRVAVVGDDLGTETTTFLEVPRPAVATTRAPASRASTVAARPT